MFRFPADYFLSIDPLNQMVESVFPQHKVEQSHLS